MKIKSREKVEVRKVGDEGVFDFKDVSYDDAISTLHQYYADRDGTDDMCQADDGYGDEGDYPADDCCCDCECDDGDYEADMTSINAIKMPILQHDFWKMEPITASSFPPMKPLSDVEIRETVALVQRGIMSYSQAQLLSAEKVKYLADEMTRNLVVPTPNILK